jgi:hypothetical protein
MTRTPNLMLLVIQRGSFCDRAEVVNALNHPIMGSVANLEFLVDTLRTGTSFILSSSVRCPSLRTIGREFKLPVNGPTRFRAEMKEALATLGVASERVHVEIFNGSESMPPVSSAERRELRIRPGTMPAPVSSYGSRAVTCQRIGRLRSIRVFGSWTRRATSRSVAGRNCSKCPQLQPSPLLPATDSRRRHRFVKLYRNRFLRWGTRPFTIARAESIKGRTIPLLRAAFGRKWRMRAPHIRPKPRRGATIATCMAVVKLAKTPSDRCLAMRRVRRTLAWRPRGSTLAVRRRCRQCRRTRTAPRKTLQGTTRAWGAQFMLSQRAGAIP